MPVGDFKNPDGKTVREKNMERLHRFTIGTLVEISTGANCPEWNGVRLYVTNCTRDCDGSPLYELGPNWTVDNDLEPKSFGRFSDDSLTGM
jgi:hypothetical protein